ncbi:MAG TPA: hypothetical protein VGM75_09875 [Pseudonocardiaceae bacterium]
MSRRLFIETVIRCDLDTLWHRTQDPAQHQRWDLRFTRIHYLPRPDPGQPQRFRYTVRVLPGLTVSGVGSTVAERGNRDGCRTSVLRFASADPLSLIQSGAGYWRYLPTEAGIRFWTGYDYRPGWGRAGPVADLLFRPLMRWGTAWSFDRLRLWLERGVTPERSLRNALLDAGGRLVVCAIVGFEGSIARAVIAGAALAVLPPLPTTPAARRCRTTARSTVE